MPETCIACDKALPPTAGFCEECGFPVCDACMVIAEEADPDGKDLYLCPECHGDLFGQEAPDA